VTAPVPTTLEDLLHAVVEACVQEIAEARSEARYQEALRQSEHRDHSRILDAREADYHALEDELAALRLELARTKGALDAVRGELVDAEDLRARTPRPPRAPTAERSADAATRTAPPRSPAVEAGKDAEATPSGGAVKPSAQPTAVGASSLLRRPRVDFTDHKLGTFVGIEPTAERRVGAVVWLFRCSLCGDERRWTSNNVNAIRKKSGSSFRCTCQGGSKGSATGRSYRSPGPPVRHIPVPREEHTDDLGEDFSELDDGFRGDPDDLRGLASGGLGDL
jgi:hypothetical protein